MAEKDKKNHLPMEPSFLTVVMMLSGSAMGYLEAAGKKELENKRSENLELARFTIDLLGVLESKTKGNLSQEEDHLLQKSLAELRLLYVKTAE
jgi:uncharacterized membrane protein YgcG